jgi:hypothetical protein
MNELVIGAIGVLFGFILSLAHEWWQRRRKQSAAWAAIAAECDYCRQLAERYIQSELLAPLYRLPTTAHSNALPVLLGDGALDRKEVAALIQFVAEVEELNRGLDRCASASNESAQIAESKRSQTLAHRLTRAGATFQSAQQVHDARSPAVS